MNTSFRETLRGVLASAHQRRIIARRWLQGLLLLAGALTLVACSAARLAYNQAPQLAYWWLDSHVDFSNGQSAQVRQDIDAFFQWHRSSELPAYGRLLAHWQALASADLTPAQVCQQFQAVRQHLDQATERSVEPLARLALQLDARQLDHLQRHHVKSNQTFEKDFLQGSAEQRLKKRLNDAIDRSERIYGKLSSGQRELLREQLQASPWDPQRTQAERQRRQADQLQTVRSLQASPATAASAVREHMTRIGQSPTPGYPEYSQRLVQHGCAQFAALHNSTTPEQRANAVRALQAYQDDALTLSAQR